MQDAAPIWQKINGILKKEIGPQTYATWIQSLRALAITRDKHLVLRAISDDQAVLVLDKHGDRMLAIADEMKLPIEGVVIRDTDVQAWRSCYALCIHKGVL